MVQASSSPLDLAHVLLEGNLNLSFQLPNPEDGEMLEAEFQQQVNTAWEVCDRFDLQTEIWRGRILRAVRDRERRGGEGRGIGFLNWLKDREISKSRAYQLIELADSADTLLETGDLEPEMMDCFSKRAFIETAQATPEVQQLVTDAARRGDRITRREVRQLADEWTAMTSELIPAELKAKAANNTIPPRYLAPLARELEKLPLSHQTPLQAEVAANPDLETLKQVTAEARDLARYLAASAHVQALAGEPLDLEIVLEEALRLGCLNVAADLVNQAAQLEQTLAKLFTTWKRVQGLSDKLDLESGASTPNLRSLLRGLERLTGEVLEVQLNDPERAEDAQFVRLRMLSE